jgi:hypothetical protein
MDPGKQGMGRRAALVSCFVVFVLRCICASSTALAGTRAPQRAVEPRVSNGKTWERHRPLQKRSGTAMSINDIVPPVV